MNARRDFVIREDADRVLKYLAAVPKGATSCVTAVLRRLMLDTMGEMHAHGGSYTIKAKSLGGGAYRVSLEPKP